MLNRFGFLKIRHKDYDWIDELSTRFFCLFAAAVGFLLIASEYGVTRMRCWDKASWDFSWKQYAEDLCFIEGTHFVDLHSTLPRAQNLGNYKKVQFYQWVPLVYFFLAILFFFPRHFWSRITSSTYWDFETVCVSSAQARTWALKLFLYRFLNVALKPQSLKPPNYHISFLNRLYDKYFVQNYLIISYILMKIWQILNTFIGFFLLSFMIADNPKDFSGAFTMWNLLKGVDWRITGIFPRSTTCVIRIRQIQNHTMDTYKTEQVQCLLTTNVFIEKLFMITWGFFAALLIINCWSLGRWIFRISKSRIHITRNVDQYANICFDYEKMLNFIDALLPNARFIILMIECTSGDRIAAKFAWSLYNAQGFRENNKEKKEKLKKMNASKGISNFQFNNTTADANNTTWKVKHFGAEKEDLQPARKKLYSDPCRAAKL